METIKVKEKQYLTIKEAQIHVVNRSPRWFRDRIKEGDIKAASKGQGSDYMILTQSLLDYLESLQG
jgi:hypothetical protein